MSTLRDLANHGVKIESVEVAPDGTLARVTVSAPLVLVRRMMLDGRRFVPVSVSRRFDTGLMRIVYRPALAGDDADEIDRRFFG